MSIGELTRRLVERREREEADQAARTAQAYAKTEPAPDGPAAPPGSALARLREMAGQYALQFDLAHKEHTRKVNTIATELVAIQTDLIKALEARIVEQDARIAELEGQLLTRENQLLVANGVADGVVETNAMFRAAKTRISELEKELETSRLDRAITAEMHPPLPTFD